MTRVVLTRIYRSINHRPWTIDVVSGLTSAYWGLWVAISPTSVENPKAFDFLNAVDPYCIAFIAIFCGLSQFAAAMVNVMWWRWISAFACALLFSFLSFGIIHSSPTPAVAPYSGWALGNLLILARLY